MGAAGGVQTEEGHKGWLPEELLRKIVGFVPRRPRDLQELCAISRAWRQAATRDAVWEPICRQAVGGKPLLDRILGGHRPAAGYHAFFLQHRRALACARPTLTHSKHHHNRHHHSPHRPPSSSSSAFSHPPPPGFFDPFVWVLELRDGEEPEGRLLYSCVLEMSDPRLFTSAGAAVVGQGIQLGVDVKARLAPSSLGSSSSSGGGGGDVVGAVEEKEEEEAGKDKVGIRRSLSGRRLQRRRLSPSSAAAATATTEEEEAAPPGLVFRLWVYDRKRQRAACFVASRLVTDRPRAGGRWHGRRFDGPFSGPDGGPTTLVLLDENHRLRVLPVVEMVDQWDRIYLMSIRVDLQLCQCSPQQEEPNPAAYGLKGGDWELAMPWSAAGGRGSSSSRRSGAGGGCHCLPGSGLGMIPEEGTWILLHDLLETKLRWC